MNERTKKALRTAGILILIVIVSGVLAYRKYYRKEQIRKQQFERSEEIMEVRKAQHLKEREALKIEERNRQDSISQVQSDELEAKVKETEEILKALESEK